MKLKTLHYLKKKNSVAVNRANKSDLFVRTFATLEFFRFSYRWPYSFATTWKAYDRVRFYYFYYMLQRIIKKVSPSRNSKTFFVSQFPRKRSYVKRTFKLRKGPNAVKFLRTFYRPYNTKGLKSTQKTSYPIAIRAKSSFIFSPRLLEQTRLIFSRPLKSKAFRYKKRRYFIKLFPSIAITRKPLQSRMGKGKGKRAGYIIGASAGKTLFEITSVLPEKYLSFFKRKINFRLPTFVKISTKTRNDMCQTYIKNYGKIITHLKNPGIISK